MGEDEAERPKKGPKLRPDLPGGRRPKGAEKEDADSSHEERGAMRGRGDDAKLRPQKGERTGKKRGRGDQGAWG